jgi:hemerythrin-like domain-containing protein
MFPPGRGRHNIQTIIITCKFVMYILCHLYSDPEMTFFEVCLFIYPGGRCTTDFKTSEFTITLIMKNFNKDRQLSFKSFERNRRDFLRRGIILGALTGITGLQFVTAQDDQEEGEVTPSEDLMREHGVLNRILLIYDSFTDHLGKNEPFDLAELVKSAQIIRTFIEDYHEKLEEEYLFPRFEKANTLTELTRVLRSQHTAGRTLTDQILEIGKAKSLSDPDERHRLIRLLSDFKNMYRPHEAREDTVLFPAIRRIVSRNEYFALGEDFEEREHKLFGEDGFDTIVEKVAGIEKQLGIYDLSIFTPKP